MEKYCKILIIDDEMIMRQGIKYMLNWEQEGFQLAGEASDGKEGLRLMEELRPDIVLLDVVMPVLDGIEFSDIVREKYPEIQFIILSGYDNFEYVKATLLNGAVDYILKPAINPETLLAALQKAAKRIPGMELKKSNKISLEMQLERWILGYQDEITGIELEKELPHSRFRIVGINLRQMCDKKESMAHTHEVIRSYLKTEDTCKIVSFLLKKEILLLIFNYRVKEEERINNRLKYCIDKLSVIRPKVFAVASDSFQNFQYIRKGWQREIQPLLGMNFYFPGQNLLLASKELQEEKVQMKEPRFAYENYNNYLIHGQLAEALGMFQEYIRSLCELRIEEFKLKNLSKNLLYNFLIEAEQHGVNAESIQEQYFEEIEQALSVEHFLKALDLLVAELGEILNFEEISYGEKIRKMKKYIAENYGQNLTLALLSERFGFSYHYLSHYFNKQAKEGFSEYLNRIRIQKACELLKEQEKSISEISRQIGYSDHAYFCRVFKKITGQTPTNYRRMQKW